MPRKKDNPQVSLKVGNISGVNGELNIAGRDITTNKTSNGLRAQDIHHLFGPLYAAIAADAQTPLPHKEDLQAEVREIQSSITEAAQKNEKVDEGFLSRRFRNIARMAPDLLDVVVGTLANPLAGLGVAVKKIAEKAKKIQQSDSHFGEPTGRRLGGPTTLRSGVLTQTPAPSGGVCVTWRQNMGFDSIPTAGKSIAVCFRPIKDVTFTLAGRNPDNCFAKEQTSRCRFSP